ncbi:MAG TPA: DUF4139 domain-containing protein [Gemmatimonadota bacterium]|nr:DUF4139 domain-containing protein [Gemmatimonadota bacterium]
MRTKKPTFPAAAALLAAAAFLLLVSAPRPAAAQADAAAPGSPGSDVAAPGADVAIYPGGPALVRERLSLPLAKGTGTVAWTSPPGGLDFTSLSLAFPELRGAEVVAQRRLAGSGGLEGLLRASVGRRVELALAGGDTLRATLLSVSNGLLLREAGGRVVGLSSGQVRAVLLPDLPDGYREGPAVSWTVRSPRAATARAEARYLTGGVTWNAEYALTLDPSARGLDLEAWADLRDGTGRSWPDARVRLVAGELNRAAGGQQRGAPPIQFESAKVAAAGPDQAAERSFSEYHVFELPRPVSLRDGETVRALLLRASGVPTRKLYLFHGGEAYPYGSSRPITQPEPGGPGGETNVTAVLELATGKGTPISTALPAGRARIYERDADGTELLAGEADVPNLMVGDTVRLPLGLAFDLTAERTRTDFARPTDRSMEESWKIVLRSAREEPVDVRVTERMFRWHEWEIVKETVDGKSVRHAEPDADHAAWTVTVPPGGTAALEYTVRYAWEPADLR